MVRTLDYFGQNVILNTIITLRSNNNYIVNLDFVAISQTKSKSKNNLALETILGCLFHTGHKNAQENPKNCFTWMSQKKNFRILC